MAENTVGAQSAAGARGPHRSVKVGAVAGTIIYLLVLIGAAQLIYSLRYLDDMGGLLDKAAASGAGF